MYYYQPAVTIEQVRSTESEQQEAQRQAEAKRREEQRQKRLEQFSSVRLTLEAIQNSLALSTTGLELPSGLDVAMNCFGILNNILSFVEKAIDDEHPTTTNEKVQEAIDLVDLGLDSAKRTYDIVERVGRKVEQKKKSLLKHKGAQYDPLVGSSPSFEFRLLYTLVGKALIHGLTNHEEAELEDLLMSLPERDMRCVEHLLEGLRPAVPLTTAPEVIQSSETEDIARVTLFLESGTNTDFEFLGTIVMDGEKYLGLTTYAEVPQEDDKQSDVFFMRKVFNEQNKSMLKPVEDQTLAIEIFKSFQQKYADKYDFASPVKPNEAERVLQSSSAAIPNNIPRSEKVKNAVWMVYDQGGEVRKKETKAVQAGTIVQPLQPPIRQGYVFIGWFSPSDKHSPFDFQKPIATNVFLFAKYEPVKRLNFFECQKTLTSNDLLNSEGKLIRYPEEFELRMATLVYLTAKLHKYQTYDEKEINEELLRWHVFDAWSLLRRELLQHHFVCRKSRKVYQVIAHLEI
ncbi:MAG: DUF2087 domain-containing protein [Firmicutes bacterium]|nr:DUF2087 domain-containing protein [Bacillota bacterium]